MRIRSLIEKRTVDPVNLAQRVGKRYGTDKDYGYYQSDTQPGKYIPLKNYNDDLVDNMEEARHQLFKKMGYEYSKNNRKEINQKIESEFGNTQKININQLVATQPFVRIEDIDILKQKVISTKQIYVAKYLNNYFILDGHHATLAASLRGEKTITAKIVDFDAAMEIKNENTRRFRKHNF
jgi:hypothetical protein